MALLRAWQGAKASALGPEHDTSMLSQCLSAPLSREWKQRAETAKAKGVYWTFDLDKILIEK